MTREEAQFWCGFYGIPWPTSDVKDVDAFLDGVDARLAGVGDQDRASCIMQALYSVSYAND